MKVCVVGAGVVGCATAFELALAGHQVTLMDAAAGPGTGTSFANGAQLSYSYVEPLANPATLRALPKLLTDPASPVRFRLRADPHQWAWGARFLMACTRRAAQAGTGELLALGALSRQTLDGWVRDHGLAFSLRRNGKLVLCADAAMLRQQARQVQLQARAGAVQQVLGRSECLAHEPALADHPGFVGGVWTPDECAGDPYQYCQSLVALLRKAGGQCLFNTTAQGFELRGARAVAVRTPHGAVQADAFVVANGLQARALAAALGERLALYPIKGYSMTLKYRHGAQPPRVNVTDLAHKMVLAPMDGALRVAAMAEITGTGLAIAPDRLQRMAQAVEQIYPGLCSLEETRPWAGLRPATPDSVPVIRAARGAANVILNVGHGALGFTLAAGSARRVRGLLAGGVPVQEG
ncbi:MAG: FAD-dependent oxidoreductase [Ramlibacter sp.]